MDDVIDKEINSNYEGDHHNNCKQVVVIREACCYWFYRIPDGHAEKNEVGHLDGEVRYHSEQGDVHPFTEIAKEPVETTVCMDRRLFYILVSVL